MNAPSESGREEESPVALEPILSSPIIPSAPKAANSSGSSGGTGFTSGGTSGGIGGDSGSGTSGASIGSSSSNSSSSSGTSTSGSSSSSGSSHAASGSAAANRNSGGTTPSSGKGASSRSKSNSTSSAQSKQNASQAQSTGAAANAANAKNGVQQESGGPSFMQALAQSQADAQTNAIAAPASQDLTGSGSDKSKADSKDAAGAPPPGSLDLIAQSLAAAMAGIQQPTPVQTAASAGTAADEGDSTDGVSLTGGSSAPALLALTKGMADGLNATTDPTAAAGGPKTDTPVSSAPAADSGNAAVSAFQAQMSISSHFQQVSANTHAKVSAPVGTSGFNNEIGDKITWMANQGVQSASLQVTPEHLGPVEVRISVQEGSASVTFNAVHPDARAALEQALPRLREMFASQGLNLSDASVSH